MDKDIAHRSVCVTSLSTKQKYFTETETLSYNGRDFVIQTVIFDSVQNPEFPHTFTLKKATAT